MAVNSAVATSDASLVVQLALELLPSSLQTSRLLAAPAGDVLSAVQLEDPDSGPHRRPRACRRHDAGHSLRLPGHGQQSQAHHWAQ